MKKIYISLLAFCGIITTDVVMAGNPDRQGEAGANQLLINPWARSAGLHSINTSSITGGDAMFLNVAGLARVQSMQIQMGHTRYLDGADIGINALSFAKPLGKKGSSFGFSLVAFDLGDFETTTEQTPEGSGATFSPSFTNLGLSFAHVFENKVSVGVTAKFVNEAITNVSARALALDAGVQYVTGKNDNFKFGISLRNVGNKMRFTGEGLSRPLSSPNTTFPYQNTYYDRSATYELPSQLNIGASYDWILTKTARLSAMGNFCSNAFSRDQIGGGLEFRMGDLFALRAAYKTELNVNDVQSSLDNGLAAGFSVSVPVKKGSETRLAIDYGYRYTKIYNGIHNIGLRIDL